MIGYVRARLANYSRYCMVCHKKHTCARYSHPRDVFYLHSLTDVVCWCVRCVLLSWCHIVV
jgi:hypothetical protein